jgi:hypothetical protein
VSIRLLNCQTRNPSRSCISRSTSQSHSLSDSISQRASLFTYHLVRAGYSPVPSSRFTLTTSKTLVSSPTDYASSGSGSEHRTVTYAELATGQIPLKSSRTCHRHVTGLQGLCRVVWGRAHTHGVGLICMGSGSHARGRAYTCRVRAHGVARGCGHMCPRCMHYPPTHPHPPRLESCACPAHPCLPIRVVPPRCHEPIPQSVTMPRISGILQISFLQA